MPNRKLSRLQNLNLMLENENSFNYDSYLNELNKRDYYDALGLNSDEEIEVSDYNSLIDELPQVQQPVQENQNRPQTSNIAGQINATGNEIGYNVLNGFFDFFEGIGDALIGVFGEVGSWFGASDERATDAIQYDWSKDVATGISKVSNLFSPTQLIESATSGDWSAYTDWNYFGENNNRLSEELYNDSLFNYFGDDIHQGINDFTSNIGQQLPNVILAVATGGTSLAGSAGLKAGSLLAFGTSAMGQSTEQNLSEGHNLSKSLLHGLVSGAVEAGTEMIPWKGGNAISGVLGREVKLSLGKELARSFLEEGVEEVISDLASPFVDTILLDEGESVGEYIASQFRDPNFYANLGKDFLMGGLSSVVLGGIDTTINRAKFGGKAGADYVRYSANVLEYKNQLDELNQTREKRIARGKDTTQIDKSIAKTTENLEKETQKLVEASDNLKGKEKQIQKVAKYFSQIKVESSANELNNYLDNLTKSTAQDYNYAERYIQSFSDEFQKRYGFRPEITFADIKSKKGMSNVNAYTLGNSLIIDNSFKDNFQGVLAHETSHTTIDTLLSDSARDNIYNAINKQGLGNEFSDKIRNSQRYQNANTEEERQKIFKEETIAYYLENQTKTGKDLESTFINNSIINQIFNKDNFTKKGRINNAIRRELNKVARSDGQVKRNIRERNKGKRNFTTSEKIAMYFATNNEDFIDDLNADLISTIRYSESGESEKYINFENIDYNYNEYNTDEKGDIIVENADLVGGKHICSVVNKILMKIYNQHDSEIFYNGELQTLLNLKTANYFMGHIDEVFDTLNSYFNYEDYDDSLTKEDFETWKTFFKKIYNPINDYLEEMESDDRISNYDANFDPDEIQDYKDKLNGALEFVDESYDEIMKEFENTESEQKIEEKENKTVEMKRVSVTPIDEGTNKNQESPITMKRVKLVDKEENNNSKQKDNPFEKILKKVNSININKVESDEDFEKVDKIINDFLSINPLNINYEDTSVKNDNFDYANLTDEQIQYINQVDSVYNKIDTLLDNDIIDPDIFDRLNKLFRFLKGYKDYTATQTRQLNQAVKEVEKEELPKPDSPNSLSLLEYLNTKLRTQDFSKKDLDSLSSIVNSLIYNVSREDSKLFLSSPFVYKENSLLKVTNLQNYKVDGVDFTFDELQKKFTDNTTKFTNAELNDIGVMLQGLSNKLENDLLDLNLYLQTDSFNLTTDAYEKLIKDLQAVNFNIQNFIKAVQYYEPEFKRRKIKKEEAYQEVSTSDEYNVDDSETNEDNNRGVQVINENEFNIYEFGRGYDALKSAQTGIYDYIRFANQKENETNSPEKFIQKGTYEDYKNNLINLYLNNINYIEAKNHRVKFAKVKAVELYNLIVKNPNAQAIQFDTMFKNMLNDNTHACYIFTDDLGHFGGFSYFKSEKQRGKERPSVRIMIDRLVYDRGSEATLSDVLATRMFKIIEDYKGKAQIGLRLSIPAKTRSKILSELNPYFKVVVADLTGAKSKKQIELEEKANRTEEENKTLKQLNNKSKNSYNGGVGLIFDPYNIRTRKKIEDYKFIQDKNKKDTNAFSKFNELVFDTTMGEELGEDTYTAYTKDLKTKGKTKETERLLGAKFLAEKIKEKLEEKQQTLKELSEEINRKKAQNRNLTEEIKKKENKQIKLEGVQKVINQAKAEQAKNKKILDDIKKKKTDYINKGKEIALKQAQNKESKRLAEQREKAINETFYKQMREEGINTDLINATVSAYRREKQIKVRVVSYNYDELENIKKEPQPNKIDNKMKKFDDDTRAKITYITRQEGFKDFLDNKYLSELNSNDIDILFRMSHGANIDVKELENSHIYRLLIENYEKIKSTKISEQEFNKLISNFKRNVLNQIKDKNVDNKNKKALIVIGVNGEANTLKQVSDFIKKNNAYVIDTNDVRALKSLENTYQDGLGATLVNNIAQTVSNSVESDLTNEGYNIVLQNIDFSYDGLKSNVNELINKGYSVELRYADISYETAINRAFYKAITTGYLNTFTNTANEYYNAVDIFSKIKSDNLGYDKKAVPLFKGISYIKNETLYPVIYVDDSISKNIYTGSLNVIKDAEQKIFDSFRNSNESVLLLTDEVNTLSSTGNTNDVGEKIVINDIDKTVPNKTIKDYQRLGYDNKQAIQRVLSRNNAFVKLQILLTNQSVGLENALRDIGFTRDEATALTYNLRRVNSTSMNMLLHGVKSQESRSIAEAERLLQSTISELGGKVHKNQKKNGFYEEIKRDFDTYLFNEYQIDSNNAITKQMANFIDGVLTRSVFKNTLLADENFRKNYKSNKDIFHNVNVLLEAGSKTQIYRYEYENALRNDLDKIIDTVKKLNHSDSKTLNITKSLNRIMSIFYEDVYVKEVYGRFLDKTIIEPSKDNKELNEMWNILKKYLPTLQENLKNNLTENKVWQENFEKIFNEEISKTKGNIIGSVDNARLALKNNNKEQEKELNGAFRKLKRYLRGFTNAEMEAQNKTLLEKYGENLSKYAQSIQNYFKDLLDYRVENGLITEDERKVMNDYYPHYVPTPREHIDYGSFNFKNGSTNTTNSVLKREGSGQVIRSIITSATAMTNQVVKNVEVTRLLNLMEDRARLTNTIDRKDLGIVFNYDTDTSKEQARNYSVKELVEKLDNQSEAEKDANTITYRKNGIVKKARFTDEAVQPINEVYNSHIFDDMPGMTLMSKATKAFSNAVTSWSPFFVFRNMNRDFFDAILKTRNNRAEFVKEYIKSYKQLFFPMLRNSLSTNEDYNRYKMSGGGASGFFLQTRNANTTIRDIIREDNSKFKKFNLGRYMSVLNQIVEQAPRFAEYKLSYHRYLKNGYSEVDAHTLAMRDSAEITVDFSNGGTWTKSLNRTLIPFLNAQIQGALNTYRFAVRPRKIKELASTLVLLLLLGLAPEILNMLMWDDEDYTALPEYTKQQYLLIPVGDGNFIRIPRGRLLGTIQNFFRNVVETSGERKDISQAFKDQIDATITNLSPIQENGIRTIFAPITDVISNTTWYGQDIDTQSDLNKYPGQRFDSSTSELGKFLGKIFNYSPKRIDYLLEQYTGFIGDIGIPLMTTGGANNNQPGKVLLEFVKDNYLIDTVKNNKYRGEFYDLRSDFMMAKSSGDDRAGLVYNYLNRCLSDLNTLEDILEEAPNEATEYITYLTLREGYKNAITNANMLYEKLQNIDVDVNDKFSITEAYRQVFGSEYALEYYSSSVKAKADNFNKIGGSYDTFYIAYFDLRGMSNTAEAENYIRRLRLTYYQRLYLYKLCGGRLTDYEERQLSNYLRRYGLEV